MNNEPLYTDHLDKTTMHQFRLVRHDWFVFNLRKPR